MKKIFLIIFIAILIPCFAKADVAPTPFNRGGTMFGIEDTMVEMTYEKVVFSNFQVGENIYGMTADVRADFVMTNLGGEDESMKVYFPFYFRDNPEYGDDTVKNVKVLIDGKEVNFKRDEGKYEISFDAKFVASKKTNISILYTCNLQEPGHQSFEGWNMWGVEYVLHTGALWKNSIGEGEIIFKFPYSVEDQEKLFTETLSRKILNNEACSPGDYLISGNEIIFKFKNLEPTEKDDIYCNIYNPTDWMEYLKSVDEVKKNPTYENYLKLADYFDANQLGSEKKYFENINKALEIKYPEKTLDYYEEALKYYTQNWAFFPQERDLNYYDLNSVVEIKNELLKMKSSLKRDELLGKIEFGFFHKTYSEPICQNLIGDGCLEFFKNNGIEVNENFKNFLMFLSPKRGYFYNDELRNWYDSYKKGDYSFMDATTSNAVANDSLSGMSVDAQRQTSINEQEKKKIQRDEKKKSSSSIVYIIASLAMVLSVGIFVISKKFIKK